MKRFLQDLRYALRQLRRSPGFAAVAILTLALGIGANTAIFSVLDSILLQPLPFPHAGSRLTQIDPQTDYLSFPKGWVREYQRRATTFSSISGYTLNTEYNVTGGSVSDRAFGSTVSTNLFDTLGVRPSLGRSFSPAEEEAGQDRVVILSHGYWQQHFGADPNVLGKKILIDGVDREIIGKAYREYRKTEREREAERLFYIKSRAMLVADPSLVSNAVELIALFDEKLAN